MVDGPIKNLDSRRPSGSWRDSDIIKEFHESDHKERYKKKMSVFSISRSL
jgi:hypothetical protein